MMNPFSALGDMGKLKKMYDDMKKNRVEFEKDGVKLVMQGDMKIISLEVGGEQRDDIVDVINEAQKKLQESMAKNLVQ